MERGSAWNSDSNELTERETFSEELRHFDEMKFLINLRDLSFQKQTCFKLILLRIAPTRGVSRKLQNTLRYDRVKYSAGLILL